MKILSCHIENFGKLKDLTIDFTDNLQVVYEQNGWGKSTLAAFIKIMFYGFANDRSRSELENERKKYKPWQGGVYGGEIAFEVNGKTYEFIRTFGTKEKDDTFMLYDRKTNLPSDDYATGIGAELFKIDRESFTRTVFIAQQDIATNATDSINAKIGNLVENTDDINNYETVQKRFKDLLNQTSPTRKTGIIKQKKEEIARLYENIRRGEILDQTLDELGTKLQERKKIKDKLKEEQSTIQRQMEQTSEFKDLSSGKQEYERICTEYTKAIEAVAKEQSYFPAIVPAEADVHKMLAEADKVTRYQGELQSLTLTDEELQNIAKLEQQFSEGIPEQQDLERCKEKIKQYADLRLEIARAKPSAEDEGMLARLETKFHNQIPEDFILDQYILRWNQRTEKKSGLGANKATLNTLKTMHQLSPDKDAAPEKGGFPLLLILGIAVFLVGILGLTGLLFHSLLGIIGCGAGMVLIILSVLMKRRQPVRSTAPPDVEGWRDLEDQIARDELDIQAVETDLQTFFHRYGINYVEANVISILYRLKEQVQSFNELAKRKQNYAKSGLESKSQMLEREVSGFLRRYYPNAQVAANNDSAGIQKLEDHISEYQRLNEQARKQESIRLQYDLSHQMILGFIKELGMSLETLSLTAQLREIYDHVRSLAAAHNMVGEKKKEKDQFEKEHVVARYEELKAVGELPQLEELNEQFSSIISKLDTIEAELASYNRQMDGLTEEHDQIDEDAQQWQILNEQLKEDQHRYHILSKTKEFLEMAKENFTARYIEPVMNGFIKYHGFLDGGDASNYKIDANINLTAKEQGQQRNPKLLSTGYQDLIGLCMRMALVDAMFQEEKPFIIIDDSFVNLDDDKVKGGLDFLKEIAAEYQVIYFTCHESRS